VVSPAQAMFAGPVCSWYVCPSKHPAGPGIRWQALRCTTVSGVVVARPGSTKVLASNRLLVRDGLGPRCVVRREVPQASWSSSSIRPAFARPRPANLRTWYRVAQEHIRQVDGGGSFQAPTGVRTTPTIPIHGADALLRVESLVPCHRGAQVHRRKGIVLQAQPQRPNRPTWIQGLIGVVCGG
jgi:hypothetical protein